MKHLAVAGFVLFALCGCVHPYRLVYSNAFTFARYDYIVVAKPNENTATTLYGMDIELANQMSRYNMKIIGDKEYESLTQEQKQQTLFARMSLIASDKKDNLISISFDDGVTGKTVASITSRAHGDMFDTSDRTKAFEHVSNELVEAIKRDKGLSVTDTKLPKGSSTAAREHK